MFVLEDPKAKIIRGTCQVFGQVGVVQPFYCYHLSTLTQTSPELGKTFRNQMLSLTTDLEGSSEVGGLFLHPEMRAGGWGSLLARSRYLFIKQHRARFGDRIARRASRSHGRGRQRAVLGWARRPLLRHDLPGGRRVQRRPRHAIHRRPDAQDPDLRVAADRERARRSWASRIRRGRAALRMLEEEGFVFDRYIDIFDGGPTVTAQTDDIRTIREARTETVARDRAMAGRRRCWSPPAG